MSEAKRTATETALETTRDEESSIRKGIERLRQSKKLATVCDYTTCSYVLSVAVVSSAYFFLPPLVIHVSFMVSSSCCPTLALVVVIVVPLPLPTSFSS